MSRRHRSRTPAIVQSSAPPSRPGGMTTGQSGGQDARRENNRQDIPVSRSRISSAHQLASCSLLSELDEEPDNQSSNDEEHQGTHSRGRSAITLSTSCLPILPADLRFGLRDGRNKIRHRSASWMLCDMLWRGSLHHRLITNGGTRATPARTVQTKSEFTFAAVPAIVTIKTHITAMNTWIDLSCIL
jgi:hypothetical protein